MVWIGYVGLTALVLCWIPQSIDTIKQGRCPVNMAFLVLSALGSFSLAFYALSLGNMVFTILNSTSTVVIRPKSPSMLSIVSVTVLMESILTSRRSHQPPLERGKPSQRSVSARDYGRSENGPS
jgi:MtN3 and saliva related transmembrane protein